MSNILPTHKVMAIQHTSALANLPDTTQGVHFGNTFTAYSPIVNGQRALSPAGMPPTDYVWGSSPTGGTNVPDTTNGWQETYTPWRRETVNQNLAWLKSNHPDWIEYKCDRTTIAYWYPGQTDMPDLDMTNPAYQSYFVNTFALPALARGYQGISFDNGPDINLGGECGHYDANHNWVAQYSGAILNDAAYATANGNAMLSIANAIHVQYPNATLTSNQGYNTYTLKSNWEKVLPGVNMITDEYSFNSDGTGFVTSDAGGEPRISNQWLDQMQEWQRTQKVLNKGIFFIDVLPITTLTAYESDTDASVRADVQWVLANYLMIKYNHTYVDLVGNQDASGNAQYGYPMIPQHEYPTVEQIGSATNDFYASQGVYMRDYTNGLTIVNPSSGATFSVNLPSGRYKDLYGHVVTTPLNLAPHTGAVLLLTDTPANTPAPATSTPVPATSTSVPATDTPAPAIAPPPATAPPLPSPGNQAFSASIAAGAASNTFSGSARVGACAACSGGDNVQYLGRNNGVLRVNGLAVPADGAYTMTLACVSGPSARTVDVAVNGAAIAPLTCPANGSWTAAPATVSAPVSLRAGANTLAFYNSDPASPAPDLDRITIVAPVRSAPAVPTAQPTAPTLPTVAPAPATSTPAPANTPVPATNTPLPSGNQAFSASIAAGAASNTFSGSARVGACAACSGGDDVQYLGRNNGVLRVNGLAVPADGAYTMTLACVSGPSARTVDVAVNGAAIAPLTCPANGSWTAAPATVSAPVSLRAGANTLAFYNSDPASPAPDLDRITIATS